MWYYQIIHNTTCCVSAKLSALDERSPNRAFSSIKSGENGGRGETLARGSKPPVGPQKKLKENGHYFGKPNIQKKRALQECLHKIFGRFPEILGRMGIKKWRHQSGIPHEDIFEPRKITPKKTDRTIKFPEKPNLPIQESLSRTKHPSRWSLTRPIACMKA